MAVSIAFKFFGYIHKRKQPIYLISQYSSKSSDSIDVEALYVQPRIQDLLLKITGFDLNKIFASNYVKELKSPQYQLMTDSQLKEVQADAEFRAREKLKMPPFKKMWSTDVSKYILEKNEEICHFELTDTKYVFVDISTDVTYKDRCVSIRETDGTLRLAVNEEKDRLVHLFLPRPYKNFYMPKMFEESYLEKVLSEKRYKYVLDRACIQFEPDDPNYIRVTQRAYEHVASTNSFDELRSTRHFGPMAFYFIIHKNIDLLFKDMIDRDLLSNAVDMIQLYNIIHSNSKSAQEFKKHKLVNDNEKILQFINLEVKNKREFEPFLEKKNKIKQ